MKTKRLLAALGQIDGQYIEEAFYSPYNRKKRSLARHRAIAAAILLVFAGVMGTALAVNAEFRQMVLSFFHLEQAETVPAPGSTDSSHTQQDLGGAVKAEYIPLDGPDYDVGFGTLYQTNRAENGTIRSVRFWAVEDGAAVQVDTQKNSFQATWQEKVYQGDIYWCIYDGKISLYGDVTDSPDNANWYVAPVPGRTDSIFLYLSQGQYHEYRQYPMLYHLDTGEIEDILQETGIKELSWPNNYQWSDDLNKLLVTCGTAENQDELYYYDADTNLLSSLQSLTGIKVSNAFFADDHTLILLQMKGQNCSVFTYSSTTGQVNQTLKEVKLFEDYEGELHNSYGMMLFGGQYSLYVDETGNLSVFDLKTGKEIPVDGFIYEEGGLFSSNTSNSKLLYSVIDKNAESSLGISQLGVLNLETGVFTAFDREGYDSLQEWSVGWFDENRAVIRCQGPDRDAIYLYAF